MNKNLVFIESNTTGTGELILRKALKKGFHPIFIIKDAKKYSFLPLEKVEVVILDTSNVTILYNYISKIKNLIGIYSSSDGYLEITADLATQLNLPGTNCESIKLCRNKYLFYHLLIANNISTPSTRRIVDLKGIDSILNTICYPVVIKPEMGTGSVGVKLCNNETESLAHIRALLCNGICNILIQEYIENPEYSVETYTINGQHHILGITKKHLGQLPYFVESGHDFPAILAVEDQNRIKQVITKLLSTIQFNFGFTHIELKVIHEDVVIIEVNPRLAGGMIPILIEKATDVDVLEMLIDLYTDQPVNINITTKRFASIRHFISKIEGIIKQINFIDPYLIDNVKLIKNIGDKITIQGDFRDRVAYIITSDIDSSKCKEKADQALRNFSIELESEPLL